MGVGILVMDVLRKLFILRSDKNARNAEVRYTPGTRVCNGLDGSIPTAPTSFLIRSTGLVTSARQQKAAMRVKRVGR